MRVLGSLLVLTLLAASARAESTVDYTVKPGDSCIGIAIAVLGDRRELTTIHRLNPGLGKSPHTLVPGTVLKLPGTAPRVADAKVARAYNQVEVRRAGDDQWNPATIGNELFRAWRVGARRESSARVVFADDSAIEMRENTVVVIYGGSATAKQPGRATLETGALRTRLRELDGHGVELDTPAAVVRAGQGSAVVGVDEQRKTVVSNHVGRPAQVRGKAGGTTRVAPGFGTDVVRGKRPRPPRPLPPPPAWTAVPGLALGWRDSGASLRATWTPVSAAVSYRIELAVDTGEDTAILQLVVPAATSAIELHGVPSGAYRLTIASIDADGLESAPAPSAAIQSAVLGLAGDPPAAPTRIAPAPAPPAQRTLPIGAVLDVPAGVTCEVDGRAVVVAAGPAAIRCRAGEAAAELAVAVSPVALRPASTSAAAELRAQVGDATELPISIESQTRLAEGALVARGDAKLRIVRAVRRGMTAMITVVGLAPGAARLQLALRTSAGEVALGSIAVDVRD